MRRAGRRWAAPLAVLLGPVLLSGCIQVASLGSDMVACNDGDDGTPANGVVLMAQSVPSASWIPCLEGMPLGWHFAGMTADSDSAAFWLDSDRHGMRSIEVRLTASCDTTEATEIPSDRLDMRRMEQVTQVSPLFVGRRYYLFEGGCITVLFRIAGTDRSEPLALATQGIGTVPRDELRELVREESDGRLELDP